jgi:beta-galactosidase
MNEAQLSVLRVGESVWSMWEPSDGEFNLDWLQSILDKASEQGISVVVGTPTYAIPPWLARKHPEIMIERTNGTPIPFGHRQNVNYSHPHFKKYAERAIVKIAERYKDNPAIIGWQVDNEPGLEISRDADTFTRFKSYLKEKYRTTEKLNHEWGLVYWSHQISDWDDLWHPDGNTDPTYDLEWRTFHASLTKEYLDWQATLVRKIVPKHHFVTTCLDLGRAGTDDVAIAESLDIAAINVYYSPQDGLKHPQPLNIQGGTPWLSRHSGPELVYLLANLGRGLKQENFFVTETNATMLGHPPASGTFPPYPGQLKQVALALISRGAEMVEYWHWHTIPFGHESYWGGILPHSLQPGRTFDSFKEISETIKKIEPEILHLEPVSQVAALVSAESRWALEFQPALRTEITGIPLGDRESYRKLLNSVTDLFYASDLHMNFFGPSQLPKEPAALLEKFPMFVLPGYYIADDAVLNYAIKYAELGGHLIVTPRSAYAENSGRISTSIAPRILEKALGIHYEEFSHLINPINVEGFNASGMQATQWADSLLVDNAEVLATYQHPFFGAYPAITTNQYGKGRATYIGTLPNHEMNKAISQWLQELHPLPPIPSSNNPAIRTNFATARDGKRLHFVFNWGWESAEVNIPSASSSLINGKKISSGETVLLEGWGVEVFKEA